MVPPRFFPPRSLDLLVQWVADVASAAPELPLFYYHLDVINYTPYPINRFLELASERVPNLCGMKYTDYNSFVMGLCLDACDGKFTVLMGSRGRHGGGAGDGLLWLRRLDVQHHGQGVRPSNERVRGERQEDGGGGDAACACVQSHRVPVGELLRRGRGLDYDHQVGVGVFGPLTTVRADCWGSNVWGS